MIKKEDILADLHTHTTFSEHAFSTIKENIDELKKLGHYEFIAVTDHYFGGNSDIEDKNIKARMCYCKGRFNREDNGISVINGGEFNFRHYPNTLDELSGVDWRLIGVHSWFLDIPNTTLDELKDEIMLAFSMPFFKNGALAHIERDLHKLNGGKYGTDIGPEIAIFLEDIVHFCKDFDIYMEVNESTLFMNDGGSVDRLKYWLSIAKRNGNKLCLGTDAHVCYEVGKFDGVLQLLNDMDYPKELILNCDRDKLVELKNR